MSSVVVSNGWIGWGAVQCSLLSTCYVLSLYLWSSSQGRDHPSTIKKRFFSAFMMSIFSPIFLWFCLSEESLKRATLLEHMGLRIPGLIPATIFPLLLTAILYLGPMSMYTFSGIWKIYAEPNYWWNSFNDLMWIRNHVVAPLSEEFTYRASMMPILLQSLSPAAAIFISPFVFGIGFQFAYTTLFGAYSAFLFARTGHFAAPLLAHAFCNHMGFPNFAAIRLYAPLQQLIICILFVVGLVVWYYLLFPLTDPYYYSNTIHWTET